MARRISSLAKILKGTSDEVEKKFSISDEINKACADGITAVGAFSLIGIKRQLKAMLSELDKDDFNRDDFFSAFNTLYSLVMAPDKRAKGVFHPSQLLKVESSIACI